MLEWDPIRKKLVGKPECDPEGVVSAEHAHFEGHIHSAARGLWGLLDYAVITNDETIKQFNDLMNDELFDTVALECVKSRCRTPFECATKYIETSNTYFDVVMDELKDKTVKLKNMKNGDNKECALSADGIACALRER